MAQELVHPKPDAQATMHCVTSFLIVEDNFVVVLLYTKFCLKYHVHI